ncbi:MAG: acylphosphatase [Candidatus Anstonellaceae archaeon]
MHRIRAIAFGKVQGVGFRAFCCKVGKSCSLCGFARNLPDGSVEIVVEGEKEDADEFFQRIFTKTGKIQVEKIEIKSSRKVEKRKFASFSICY